MAKRSQAAEGARQARLPARRSCRTSSSSGSSTSPRPPPHFGVTDERDPRRGAPHRDARGCPGSTGTYQPNDLFDIDWDAFEDDDVIVIVHHVAIDDAPRLSAREAAALIAGPAVPVGARPRTPAAPRSRRCGRSSRPGASAAPEPPRPSPRPRPMRRSRCIREAVAEGRQLEFDYRNARGRSRPPAGRPAARSSRRTPTGTCRPTATPARTCATSASTA